ncbi:hypothetical protein IP70_15680 [alpha proteobacterium AAP38]|nr:hypothetical protein IP70_15680 [alpha proteobacterium AAP38]
MLTLITPAADLGLLSIAELRAAVGLAAGDGSRDAELTALGLRVAGLITGYCRVAAAGVSPPTLRAETVEEVWRLPQPVKPLILSRRFVASITSASIAGTALDAGLLELEASAGLLHRLDSADRRCPWPCEDKIVVRYVAGFSTVPDALKSCAIDLVRMMDSVSGRDPLLRAQQWEGIGREEYQITSGMAMEGGIPKDIADRLTPYVAMAVT